MTLTIIPFAKYGRIACHPSAAKGPETDDNFGGWFYPNSEGEMPPYAISEGRFFRSTLVKTG
jgi:hypothetical protein